MRLRCLVLACALCWGLEAFAQTTELGALPGRFSVGGEVGYFGDEQLASSLYITTWRAAGLYAFDERFALALEAGLVVLRSSPDQGGGDWAVRPGNPAVLGLMRGEWGRSRYQLGLGGSGPVSTIDRDGDGRLQRAALNYAAGMNGLREQWLWAPDRSTLLLRARLELPVVDKTWVVLTAEPSVFIPSRSAWGREDVDMFMPLLLSLGARHRVLWFGAYAQAVLMPTGDPDGAQLAIGPWLRAVLDKSFVEARALANVDQPLAGARGPGIWGFFLSGGGVL